MLGNPVTLIVKDQQLTSPQVTLLANLHFYTYGAQALQQHNLLEKYIYCIGITNSNKFALSLLPKAFRAKLATRDLTKLDDRRVKILWLPEVLQRVLQLTKLTSNEHANWLACMLFDKSAAPYVKETKIFHFVNGLGLTSALEAKRRGTITLCDMRAEHRDYQYAIVEEEHKRIKIEFKRPHSLLKKRLEDEYLIADYFIVPSSYAKRTYIQSGLNESRIFVVPYGVDFSHFNVIESKSNPNLRRNQQHKSTFRVVYVGQMIVRKGVHYLIEAFKDFHPADSELLLIGGFPEKNYENYIRTLAKSDNRIKFIGSIPKVKLRDFYAQSSVFVLPTLADSFGLVTLEAMACGVPVIVTENSGSQEVVREGKDGYIIKIREAEAITNYLNIFYHNPELRNQMGMSAYIQSRHFTWERYARGLLDVYNNVTSQ